MVWTEYLGWEDRYFLCRPGLKVSAGDYIEQLQRNILPTCRRPYLLGDLVLLQVWVPPHGIEGFWKNSRLLQTEGRFVSEKNVILKYVPGLSSLNYPVRAEFNRVVYGGGEVD